MSLLSSPLATLYKAVCRNTVCVCVYLLAVYSLACFLALLNFPEHSSAVGEQRHSKMNAVYFSDALHSSVTLRLHSTVYKKNGAVHVKRAALVASRYIEIDTLLLVTVT